MKALQLLDHVMLWVARVFAVSVLSFSLARLISYANEPDTVSIIKPFTTPGNTGMSTVVVYHGPTTSLIVSVLLFSCLTFGLLLIHRPIGRMIVGATAVGILAMSFCGTFHLIYLMTTASSVSVDFLHSKLPLFLFTCALNIVMQLLNIWLAFRPPSQWNKTNRDISPPLNLVNPV